MIPRKIRITGGSGSGKSYLGRKVSTHLGMPYFAIDEMWYDFSQRKPFEHKRSVPERKKLLSQMLKQKTWLLEGTAVTASRKTFDEADIIVLLRVPLRRRVWQILKRTAGGYSEEHEETVFGVLGLLWYAITSERKWNYRRKKEFANKYPEKLRVFSSADEAYEWFTAEFSHR